jgi:hypothetical protein
MTLREIKTINWFFDILVDVVGYVKEFCDATIKIRSETVRIADIPKVHTNLVYLKIFALIYTS